MAQHIIVTDYCPQWAQRYQDEAAQLQAVLGDNCIAIHHIGSTAVPGLAAKPIIDIMPVVQSLTAVDSAQAALTHLGYEYLGEFGMAGRRYLRKGGDERTHQVHIFAWQDTENILRHLAFRDYLRTHDTERAAYARLKKALALQFPRDIESYCRGKAEFVHRTEEKAMLWAQQYPHKTLR